MPDFVHLHLHTQYSLLDGLCNLKQLFARARELNMPAVAITDHGNLYGIKEFLKFGYDKSNIGPDGKPIVKPILGCEIYLTRHYDHKLKDNNHRKYYHLILLAKNYAGYKNLMKIVSTAHIEGQYYKPRVSHEIVEKYHENLICCSACLAGEIPKAITAGDMEAAQKAIDWYKGVFGDDFYLEVMLHKTEVPGLSLEVYNDQLVVNKAIFELAAKNNIKTVATNDVHFIRKEDGPVHDRLICLTTNANITDPDRLHYTQQEFLKSGDEMAALFPDHPEALATTLEIAGKIENYKIDCQPILPKFELDPAFLAQIDAQLEKYKAVIDEGRVDKTGKDRGVEFCQSVAFLCHLTYEGAHRRYGQELNAEQSERIDFELKTICRMGFPDYFLIVQDYINAMRRQGWMVGPGRGSAAGSVVAYCLGITNLDPIKYQLLFERFLNPDRISMPDIDVDFENLTAAHEYVEKKYGSDHVSRVITFGTMAAKSAIKDVARISQLSIEESNRLAKMVPDRLSEMKQKEYPFNPKLDELKKGWKVIEKEVETDDPEHEGQKITVSKTFQQGLEEVDAKITLENCFRLVPEFQAELSEESGNPLNREVLGYAKQLEGCIRQVGQHACATIIGRGNLMEYIPICLSKDKETGLDVWTSQFDGHYIEDVGMLKMDFLGLNTLSIIHATLDAIKLHHGIDIDIEAIPIDDPETYALYSRGDTTVVFQFESEGMKNWLQKLHPQRFEDLIAMNALYRPGPMDYIPDFVDRKLGLKPIEYDLPEMEPRLKDTYGVTVYQEQVMLLSQDLAGFTKGEADKLRKAMGKKQIDILNSLKDKFMSGGIKNGHPEKTLDKIWKDWEKFAQYAFNKSHATCYAWVSYQTAYLKCHYTPEFLAANLSCNLSNMEEIKKIMAECKLHNVKVLSPDVNESSAVFTVNKDGNIRFGLGAIKGQGSSAIDAIINERNANGPFSSMFEFCERVDLRKVNRKAIESFIKSGAFDCFGQDRGCMMAAIEVALSHGQRFQKDKMRGQQSLFDMFAGDEEESCAVRDEHYDPAAKWPKKLSLRNEHEALGFYLSGHPLENFSENFPTWNIGQISDLNSDETKEKLMSMAAAMGSGEPRDDNNRGGYRKKAQIPVRIAAVISAKKEKPTRDGTGRMAFLTLEDLTSSIEAFLPPKLYPAHEEIIKSDEPLMICGNLEYDAEREQVSLTANSIIHLEDMWRQQTKKITLVLDYELATEDTLKRLKEQLLAYRGDVPVDLTIIKNGAFEANIKIPDYLRIAPSTQFRTHIREVNDNIRVLVN